MPKTSGFHLAGVAQRTERVPNHEVAGKNPAPRSTILPFPRPYRYFRPGPFVVAFVSVLVAIALVVIGLSAYAGAIVFRGLP